MHFTLHLFPTDTENGLSCRWIFHFAHLRQLPVLVPYIPTENPRLRDTVYEVCLPKQENSSIKFLFVFLCSR